MKSWLGLVTLAVVASAAFLIASHTGALGAATPDGRAIFLENCAACHGAAGEGGGPYPPLAGNRDVNDANSANLIQTVLNGRSGPITVNETQYGGDMPPWRIQLSDSQIAAVLSYIRSAWNNDAPAVSAGQVTAARSPETLTGADLFTLKCSACHLASGAGTEAFPALAGDVLVTAADPSAMLDIMVNGRTVPVTVNGKSYTSLMPRWTGRLTDADVAALATYIRSSWGNRAPPVTEQDVIAAGTSVSIQIGASIFETNCATCHGSSGSGGAGPALAGDPRVNAADPSQMLTAIVQGRNLMPSWRGQLSAGDIAALATFIRASWGNNAGPVTAQEVTRL